MAEQQTQPQERATHYLRFKVAERIEHIVLLVSFTTLGVTGLVQKFSDAPLASSLIDWMGGIERVRSLHHIAAIIFCLEMVYHAVVLGYKLYVRHSEMSMLPGTKDVVDALDAVRYNLGLSPDRPRLPRYGFEEKVEYWAMLWGAAMMGLTGFMLWNPIAVTRFLPGQFIPAAKAAHGGEAVLAVLAIIVWHFYNVHVKTFNKSMFTGRLNAHQMDEEHGEELERLVGGKVRPAPNPEDLRKRERIYIPIGIGIAVLGALVVFWLATFEMTATATVPKPVNLAPAFVPLTATPIASPVGGFDNGKIGVSIPHDIPGKEQCLTCHGPQGVKPVPANHEGRPNDSCQVCHRPGATPTPGAVQPAQPAGSPPVIPHAVEGRQQCDMCHAGPGSLQPNPADHTGRTNDTCQVCHKPAGAATPVGETGSTATPAGTGGPNPIPHSIAGPTYQDCTVCHGAGRLKPYPANHAAFSTTMCASCHQQASADTAGVTPSPRASAIATGTVVPARSATPTRTMTPSGVTTPAIRTATGGPRPIPADHTSRGSDTCIACHGAERIRPFPANHVGFSPSSCTACHQPAAGGTATPVAGTTSAAASGTPASRVTPGARAPKPIPPNHVGDVFKNCTACHGVDKMKPFPANHAALQPDSCTTCHKAATS